MSSADKVAILDAVMRSPRELPVATENKSSATVQNLGHFVGTTHGPLGGVGFSG